MYIMEPLTKRLPIQRVNTVAQTKTRKWAEQKPNYRQRTIMWKKCGKKCFLGPRKSFPICTKNTCKRNKKGIHAAYVRAEEYITITGKQKYRRISQKARKMI